jgi:hypothetical protein
MADQKPQSGQKSLSGQRSMHGISIQLTQEQKSQLERFWKEHGSLGQVEIQVEVVNDRIAPASIQVGTAK